MAKTMRYQIQRSYERDKHGLYGYVLVNVDTGLVIDGTSSKAPTAPQWLLDKQALLNAMQN